jgi:agmatinase
VSIRPSSSKQENVYCRLGLGGSSAGEPTAISFRAPMPHDLGQLHYPPAAPFGQSAIVRRRPRLLCFGEPKTAVEKPRAGRISFAPPPIRITIAAPLDDISKLGGAILVKRLLRIFAILIALFFAPKLQAQAVPTFVGVRTFLGAPYLTDLKDLHTDFAVLGVPFDEGTWGQPGERYGPRDLRESSQEYNHDLTEGFYYIDGDRTVLKGKHWADVGDIEVFPTVPAQTNDKITAAVRTILSKKAFPIILGGDHSITFPVIRAYNTPLTVIHFDAHLDSWNGAPGNLDHASWVNRAGQLAHVKNIIQIGMRGLANDPESVGNARKLHTSITTSEQIHRRGVEWALAQIPQLGDIYISFDVDVMDPTLAPGTGTLEPGGLSFAEIDELLMGVAGKGHLVGFDVVEVNPYRDASGRTAQTAVRLMIDLLGAAFH